MANLRRGKTKATLESSIDSALLAVEIYNKPRTTFRSEAFVALMVMAWTRLLHAYFNNSTGDRYYYKKKGRYELIDGERRAWELGTCIKKYGKLSVPVEKNLQFFVMLRNKIEHRHIDKREVDALIFGECQALLYNYENLLIALFGHRYALNEALVYSLQFSHLRTPRQQQANKSALSKDLADIVEYVEKYRTSLDEDTYNAQEYSIKLIQIPKISNTNRADAAIEFVKWDELSPEDRAAYDQIVVIVKDKRVTVSAANVKRLKPNTVVERVNEHLGRVALTTNLHVTLYKVFRIRPPNGADDPFETNTEFCLFDETHSDYVYQDAWVEFLVHFLQTSGLTPAQLRLSERSGESLDIDQHRA
ncbi:MAG: hypothetical protein JWR16_1270 [Nevskia sp.]|nr:hypothetical protein [Nevskia sp.]